MMDESEDGSESDLFGLAQEVLNSSVFETLNHSMGLLGQKDALPIFGKPLDIQQEAFDENAESPNKREYIETLSSQIGGHTPVSQTYSNAHFLCQWLSPCIAEVRFTMLPKMWYQVVVKPCGL